MKNHLVLLLTAAVVMLSCTQGELSIETALDRTELQVGETIWDGDLLIAFSPVIHDLETKLTIGEQGAVSFVNNDAVLVSVNGTQAIYEYKDNLFKAAENSKPVRITGNEVAHIYYPYDCFTSDGVFTLGSYGGTHTDIESKNPMAAKVSHDDAVITFKNLATIIRVDLLGNADDNAAGGTLKLSSTNTALATNQDYTVDWSGSDPVFTAKSGDSDSDREITVSFNSVLDPDTPVSFYFLAPYSPTGNIEGLTVTATKAGQSFTRTRASLARSEIQNKILYMQMRAGLFYDGTGLADDPYQIKTVDDFLQMAKLVNNDPTNFNGKHYKQLENIDFSFNGENGDISSFTVGSASNAFTGTYDGDGKTLSNFTINGTPSGNEGIALFKAISGATLEKINISGAEVSGKKFTAPLVGFALNTNASTIADCHVSSSTVSGNVDYGAAGIVGGFYAGEISDCSTTDITITNSDGNTVHSYFGGLLSYVNGDVTITNCSLEGTTTINGKVSYFGGIAGRINNAKVSISGCSNDSPITLGQTGLGGIVGYMDNGSLTTCSNVKALTGTGRLGGLVGYMRAGIIDNASYNSGAVTGSADSVGGLVGEMGVSVTQYGTIKGKSYNSGAVVNNAGWNQSNPVQYLGGLVGKITSGNVLECRNAGNVTGNYIQAVGGIAGGLIIGNVDACFSKNSITITGVNYIGGLVGWICTPDVVSTSDRYGSGAKVVNSMSKSALVGNSGSDSACVGGLVGFAQVQDGKANILIGNCLNWGGSKKLATPVTSNYNPSLGGLVGKMAGRHWCVLENCYSMFGLTSISIGSNNLADNTAAETSPFKKIGPVYGSLTVNSGDTGSYASVRDCFYRSNIWNNINYLGKDDRTVPVGDSVLITGESTTNIQSTSNTSTYSLYKGNSNHASTTYSFTGTFEAAMNRCSHAANDESQFKSYNSSVAEGGKVSYKGWTTNTKTSGYTFPASLEELGEAFYN